MKKGFTLIELLVVIAIIGLLSTLAVVSFNNDKDIKYQVCDYNKNCYITDYASVSGGCVHFDGRVICGNFTREKIKQYDKRNNNSR